MLMPKWNKTSKKGGLAVLTGLHGQTFFFVGQLTGFIALSITKCLKTNKLDKSGIFSQTTLGWFKQYFFSKILKNKKAEY